MQPACIWYFDRMDFTGLEGNTYATPGSGRCLWAEAALSCVPDGLLPLIRSIACRIICRAPWAKLQKYCKYKHTRYILLVRFYKQYNRQPYAEEPIRRYLGEEINIFDVSISIQKRESGRAKKKTNAISISCRSGKSRVGIGNSIEHCSYMDGSNSSSSYKVNADKSMAAVHQYHTDQYYRRNARRCDHSSTYVHTVSQ